MRAETSVSSRQSDRRRVQRRNRAAIAVGAIVLAAGIIAVVQVTTDEGPAPTAAPPAVANAKPQPVEPKLMKGGTLEGEARRVAQRFVVTTLGRTGLAEAWTLATDDIRRAVTRKQWLAGELPIPPFPVDRLVTSGYDVIESSSTKMLIQVLLVPEAETGYEALRFDMTLIRETPSPASPWRVSYFLPYAPPGIVYGGD
jgi:hypothetical protein